jgi:hypothetical protein
LTLFILLVFSLLLFVQSAPFAEWVAERATERAAELLGREVSIGSLELEILPLTVVARDLRISGPGPLDPPFVVARRVLVEAEVGSLARPGLTVHRVRVEEPQFTIGFDEGGKHDAPRMVRRMRARSQARSPFELEIGWIEVVGGEVRLEQRRLPLEFSARNVEAELRGGEGFELKGKAAADDVAILLPRAKPYLGTVVVEGVFSPGRVQISEARIEGPDLSGVCRGLWRWREVKQLDLEIEADGRAELFDRLGYFREQASGPFHFEGELLRRPGEWFLDGVFISPAARIFERDLTALRGRFFGERRGLRFEIDSSRYGSGSVVGTVVVALGSSGPRPVDVDLELDRVPLSRLLRDQRIPVEGLAGEVSGVFSYQFERSRPRQGNGWADLQLAAVPEEETSGLPVGGTAPLTIGAGVIRSQAIRLSSESHQALATAGYDLESGSGSFDYAIATDRVDELIALLPLDPTASDPWRPGLGRGSVEGTLTVSPGGVGTVMRLDLEDVSAPGFTADRAVGHLVIEGEGIPDLRIELQRREAAMIVAGSVPFTGPDGALLGELEVSVDAAGWPLADVRVWLPWETSLDGDFSGALEVSGSLLSPTGSVQGHLTPARWEGFEADKLELSLSFDGRGTWVHEVVLGIAGGRITGEGSLSNSGELLAATVTSEVLNLEKLPLLTALPGELTGGLVLSGDITSRQGKLRMDSVVEWVDVRLAGRPVGVEGSSPIAAAWDGDYLQVEGSLAGLAQLSGGGRLDAVGAELDLQVESKRLGELLRAIGGDSVSEIEGELSGHLLAVGKTGPRPELEVRLEADHVALRRGDRKLHNLEPVVLRFEREGLVLVSLYLGEEETSSEVFVSGRIEADEPKPIDLRIQASLASDWFQAWLAGADLRGGTFDVLGEITGTLAAPRLNGVGEVREARLLVEGLPTTMDELEGVVLFYPDQIVLDSALARVAGGSVRASGSARLGDDTRDLSYQIHFSGKKLSFRYPEGWLIRGDAEVTLSSSEEGRQIGGVARLDRAFYVQDVLVGLEQLLQLLFERRRIEVGEVEEWQTGTQLNLAVEVAEGLRVRNNLADLQGSAELVLRGNLARPVVFGTVELNPGGKLDYGGNRFSLEQGLVSFTNPHRVEPILDLVATADLREYDVTLNLSGTLDRLTVDFTSDPPLAELEVLALLSGGRDPNDLSPRTPGTAEENVGAEGFLASQATFLIASRFNRLFGLDQFRIDPLTSGTGNLSSARVSVGKQLSRDLFATYSYDPSETEEQIIELEWSLSRSLILVLTQNGDGTYAVDARWEKAL